MVHFTDPTLPLYINPISGQVATKKDWYYIDHHGRETNAVDTGEVFEVVWDPQRDCWVEG